MMVMIDSGINIELHQPIGSMKRFLAVISSLHSFLIRSQVLEGYTLVSLMKRQHNCARLHAL